MKRIHGLAILAAACLSHFAGQVTPASAAEYKDFREWHAACDNLRDCTAFGLDSVVTGNAYLRLERGGAPDAPVKIVLAVDAADGVTFTTHFNDPSLPGLPAGALLGKKSDEDSLRRVVLTGTVSADTLIASIRKAEKIIITRKDPAHTKEPSDPLVSEISVSGAVAALLWIDEQQKRLDNVTALIRKGSKPASAIPAQPKPLVIIAAKPASGKPPAATAALIKKGRALCGEEDKESKLEDTWALGSNQFLYSFTCPDSSGAYNYHYGFLIANAGNAQTARGVNFAWPLKIGDLVEDPSSGAIATNPLFDAKKMSITTFSKGRGIGDCGALENWIWDGKTFKLALLKVMPHCKGIPSDDWPVLYRAEVK